MRERSLVITSLNLRIFSSSKSCMRIFIRRSFASSFASSHQRWYVSWVLSPISFSPPALLISLKRSSSSAASISSSEAIILAMTRSTVELARTPSPVNAMYMVFRNCLNLRKTDCNPLLGALPCFRYISKPRANLSCIHLRFRLSAVFASPASSAARIFWARVANSFSKGVPL